MLMLPSAILAVGSGMLVFFLMLYQLGHSAVTALSVRAGVPLSYAFVPHGSFDWFYIPTDFYLLLGLAMLFASFALTVVGKRISKTPGAIALGLVSYTFLYGLVVPLWLMRATADVTFGKRRNWRS